MFLCIWPSHNIEQSVSILAGASHGYILRVHMNEHTLLNNVVHAHINCLIQVLNVGDPCLLTIEPPNFHTKFQ
jgi:hypothetical protein